ncbi:hypothetical protein [Solimonas variicoloris]|uniref:hypothetical protein n=1 Tax=Solimonas variicoloris TaxID=254408 RepID=UPI0003A3684D|nr:hypothetical protein [Solimonas variicoloris]
MPRTPPPNASRAEARRPRWLAAAVAGALSLCAGPAAAADTLPALTGTTLELAAEAGRRSAEPQPALYAAVVADGVLLRELRVQLDDDAALRYQFSEDEARALAAGALKPLLPLAPGAHRLRAEFVARAAGGKPGATRYAAQLDRRFTADGAPLELRFSAGSLLAGASLELQAAAGDVALREVDYLLGSERPFEAALRLAVSGRDDAPRRDAAWQALGLSAAASDAAAPAERYRQALAAADGDAALRALGDAGALSPQGLRLRDLANVTLGYRELRAGRGAAAIEHFQRVRSPGPYSNAAMLGLGWCYLWPSAEGARPGDAPLRPASADALAAARRQSPFRYLQAVASGARADDLRRALIPWAELLGRDPLDPAVQEGMLAIPYALDHLGAHEQAERHYARAITALEGARATLVAARAEIADGRLLAALDARDADPASGWPRLLVEQRDDAEAVPLRVFAAADEAAAPLREYRQLRTLTRALDAAAAQLAAHDGDAALAARVDAQRARLARAGDEAAARLRAALQVVLLRLDRQTTRALAEAEFALARVYDRDPHGDGS